MLTKSYLPLIYRVKSMIRIYYKKDELIKINHVIVWNILDIFLSYNHVKYLHVFNKNNCKKENYLFSVTNFIIDKNVNKTRILIIMDKKTKL